MFLEHCLNVSLATSLLRLIGQLVIPQSGNIFKVNFKDIVPDISLFSTHSLRAGGASAAANAGVQDRLFQRHGRWKSVSAKNGYADDSLGSRLTVSKMLDI